MLAGGRLLRGPAGARLALGLRTPRVRAAVVPAAVLCVLAVGAAAVPVAGPERGAPGARIRVLDVGQGDAVLLQPRADDPILVDAGPTHADVVRRLDELGVERLEALVVTHDQEDHAGGVGQVLASRPVGALAYAHRSRHLRELAAQAAVRQTRLAAGDALRTGGIRLRVLWPPDPLLAGQAADPNARSLVILARWRHFRMLLTGDAEAESAPLDPSPIDVLKVAHHGSADAGLDELLSRASPDAAIVSVGADNPYGHPAPQTLATLAGHGVETLRTDRDGELVIELEREGWGVGPDQ
jgi:competence protein ComEC